MTHADALTSPESVARLLCGVTSPWLSRAKLTRDPLFGVLAREPFAAVRRAVECHAASRKLTV